MSHPAKIGQSVVYVSTEGHQKAAFVTATHETVTPGTDLDNTVPLSEDQVHLFVLSPSGFHGPRFQVPYYESVKDMGDFAKGGYFKILEG